MARAPARPVWVFGAGPVGTALVPTLPALGFAVTWVDARRASFPATLPPSVEIRISADPCRLLGDIPQGAFILIMTYSATLDLALAAETLDARRFPFVGMVGSAAMTGDLFSSFVKRRLRLHPSSRATGLDQVPEALFPLLSCRSALALTVADIATGVVLFFIGEVILSRLLYRLRVRAHPY